jgi:hypothetical protein
MNSHSDICFSWKYEAALQSSGIGKTVEGGDCVALLRSDLSKGQLNRKVCGEVACALVSKLSFKRLLGAADETDSRTASAADRGPDGEFGAVALRRSANGELRDRPVDLAAGDRPEVLVRNEMLSLGTGGQALRSGDWVYIPCQGSWGATTQIKG